MIFEYCKIFLGNIHYTKRITHFVEKDKFFPKINDCTIEHALEQFDKGMKIDTSNMEKTNSKDYVLEKEEPKTTFDGEDQEDIAIKNLKTKFRVTIEPTLFLGLCTYSASNLDHPKFVLECLDFGFCIKS